MRLHGLTMVVLYHDPCCCWPPHWSFSICPGVTGHGDQKGAGPGVRVPWTPYGCWGLHRTRRRKRGGQVSPSGSGSSYISSTSIWWEIFTLVWISFQVWLPDSLILQDWSFVKCMVLYYKALSIITWCTLLSYILRMNVVMTCTTLTIRRCIVCC